ncbi:MAG: pyruvate, phosphate dikinase [Promethearchaeota archaeon]
MVSYLSEGQDSKKRVYMFSEGSKEMKLQLGGKGANLAEMTRIGLPIPQGFTITCQTCLEFIDNPGILNELRPKILDSLKKIEEINGKKFGDVEDPLLVSVRSGAPISMPGMMDTILNLGLNDESVKGLAKKTNNERFALDAYRRFIQMFGDVAKGIKHDLFEDILAKYKRLHGSKAKDTDLTVEDLKRIIEDYKVLYKLEIGRDFPQNPVDQLFEAIRAVFESWNNPRAITYRNLNKIPEYGTAVNVQTMVYGNKGNTSGTGVAFTRDPSTGEKAHYGEFLPNAQGEDVVAGIRTPIPLSNLVKVFPEAGKQLHELMDKLEQHYKDMQDIEFTIEEGKLYLLQTRTGKRTAAAAVKIAIDMMEEGLIDEETALMRVDPNSLDQLLHRRIDDTGDLTLVGKGLNASPGAVTGEVVFDADEAQELGEKGRKVILVRPETKPDDIHGLVHSEGVLTQHGGMTSHAAVVARGMGKPCVAGCEDIDIDIKNEVLKAGKHVISKGEIISIDGGTGRVFLGAVPTVEPELTDEFKKLLSIADKYRKLGVRANADTPIDAKNAILWGAEGIGLCRTEHMFMAQERLPVVQEMIIAQNSKERLRALDKILPMQRGDFYEIFKVMEGKPVTIRLLDPPLHEFLPDLTEILLETQRLKLTGENPDKIVENENLIPLIRTLHESNPMMGLRGCRLGITRPEINEMQVRAIFEAACQLKKEGVDVRPEVMIPLVGTHAELKYVENQLRSLAEEIIEESGVELDYKFGTMIEIPRAALRAGEIARTAEFFSFGTNDLTQMTYGYSRDDAEGKFINIYLEKKILPDNPFQVLDRDGVGRLVKLAVEEGRGTRPSLKCGICGEHGGNPSSIEFCHDVGLNYVSCSPFRVPIARLAAAQAQVSNPRD